MKPRTQLRDIATAAGVSSACVSLALRDDPRISESTRRRVHDMADQLGYVGSPRRSAAEPLRRFGFVYCDPRATTFDPVLFEPVQRLLMSDAFAMQAHFEMMLVDCEFPPETRRTLVEFASHLDGILLYGVVRAPVVELLHKLGVPAVIVGECVIPHERVAEWKVQQVTDDPTRCGALATEYLLSRGRRRIAFVAGHRSPGLFYDQWHSGYVFAHALAGVRIDPRHVMWQQDGRTFCDEVVERLLDPSVAADAVVWADLCYPIELIPRIARQKIADADHVTAGMSHARIPPHVERVPQVMSDLAALTREAIRRLSTICKTPADGAAKITLLPVMRNFLFSPLSPVSRGEAG